MRARTVFEGNTLKGGKGDKIASKDVCPKQLAIGKKAEREHTSSAEKAEEIALDHLEENPKYYSDLVEKGMVDEEPAIKEYIKQFGEEKLPKKLMKEAQNFEKGQNPKRAMGIGGLDLKKDYQNRIDDYIQAIEGTTLSHTDEWKEFLSDSLRGKKITAEMKRLPTMDAKSGKTSGGFQKGEFTIEVQDVLPTWGMGEDFSVHLGDSPFAKTPPKLILADTDNNMYEMSMDQKIHFD